MEACTPYWTKTYPNISPVTNVSGNFMMVQPSRCIRPKMTDDITIRTSAALLMPKPPRAYFRQPSYLMAAHITTIGMPIRRMRQRNSSSGPAIIIDAMTA